MLHPTVALLAHIVTTALAIVNCIVVLRPRESFYTLGGNKRARIAAVVTVPVMIMSTALFVDRDSFGYEPTVIVLALVGVAMILTETIELPLRMVQRKTLQLSFQAQFFLLTGILMVVTQQAVQVGSSPESNPGAILVLSTAFFSVLMLMGIGSLVAALRSYAKENRLI